MRVAACLATAGALLLASLASASCSDDSSGATSTVDAGSDTSTDDASSSGDAAPDAAPAVPEYRGGTRLRPVVHTGGGAKLFQRWHDTMLGVDCQFGVGSDAALRCLPQNSSGDVLYTDSGCTQKVVALPASCLPATTPKYALYKDPAVVCAGPDVLEVGAVTTPGSVYQKDQTGACTVYAGIAMQFHSVVRTVAPTELVAATKKREARGPQLFASYLEGDDGSRQPWQIEDSAPREGTCVDQLAADGTLRCVPSNVAYDESFFGDNGCTTTAAFHPGYAPDTCNLGPLAVAVYDPTMCTYAQSFFVNGGRITGAVYQGSPGSCSVYSPPASLGATFWQKGAAIPESSFAKLKHTPTSWTPLGLDQLTVETGEVVSTPTFWDPVHTMACSEAFSLDGKRRCMPSQAGVSYFADAACQQPLVALEHRPSCAAPTPPAYALKLEPGSCTEPGKTRVFRVGAKVTPTTIYQAPSCVAQAAVVNVDYYATTGEIPASELVELSEVTE